MVLRTKNDLMNSRNYTSNELDKQVDLYKTGNLCLLEYLILDAEQQINFFIIHR